MGKTTTLNTGDNAPHGLNLLQRTLRVLDNGFETHRLIKEIRDVVGVYTYLMATASQRYYLVARATRPMLYQGCKCVSIQRALVLIADQEDRPILMANWWERSDVLRSFAKDPGRPTWRLYDPQQIRLNVLGENMRAGVWMANFEYHMGKEVSDPVFIPGTWFSMRQKRVGEQEKLPLKSKERSS